MAPNDDEDERLQSVALQNSQSILRVRIHAEDELRKQSDWLRVTLSSIGDAVISTDVEGRVNFLNGVAESLTGWSQAEARGHLLPDVFHIVNEQTRQPVDNPALRALREGIIVGLANHTLLIAKDSTELPIDDSAAPIRSPEGEIVGSVLIFRDVTERRRSEMALRDSAARKTAMFESALDCIISINHEGTIIEFNAAAERTFGHRREDVLGQELAQVIIPTAYRERHRKGLAKYLATGEGPILNQRLELPALRADGTEFPVELTVTRVPAIEPPLFSAYLRDITERRQAEEALGRLAAIVESSDDAIVSKSLDGVITSWNRGAEMIFGYTAQEAVGRHISFIIPAERLSEEDEVLSRLRRGEKVDHFETERQTKDGRRINISLTVSPVKDKAGRIIGASKVARDITARKRAEEELRHLAAKLSETDRRKSEFLAMLAHELRNPLAPIRNALQIVQLSAGSDEAVQSASQTMERQIRHMVRLVDDLLDVSRISRGKIDLRQERVELAPIIHQAVESSRPAIESAQHQLTVTLPPNPVYLDADPVRLAQVFSNLLNNASKYSDPKGRISITVEQRGGEVAVSVKDTGVGISSDMLPKIFEMFTQVDTSLERSQGGLGIGLTLVERLVEMHGGSVSARSEGPGRGSEFVVRLPILIETSNTQQPPEPTVSEPTPPRRILIVDDNRDSATTLSMLLKLTGNETHTAYDGLAAVEAAIKFKPDVVILDIGLPKLNGHEAARKIREQPGGKSIVLVALTGWGQEDDRRKSREAGFDGHMVKPVDHAALMKLLDELLPKSV
ncbi:MAG: PAS domain S-box protein [Planctomycetota bacterium]